MPKFVDETKWPTDGIKRRGPIAAKANELAVGKVMLIQPEEYALADSIRSMMYKLGKSQNKKFSIRCREEGIYVKRVV